MANSEFDGEVDISSLEGGAIGWFQLNIIPLPSHTPTARSAAFHGNRLAKLTKAKAGIVAKAYLKPSTHPTPP